MDYLFTDAKTSCFYSKKLCEYFLNMEIPDDVFSFLKGNDSKVKESQREIRTKVKSAIINKIGGAWKEAYDDMEFEQIIEDLGETVKDDNSLDSLQEMFYTAQDGIDEGFINRIENNPNEIAKEIVGRPFESTNLSNLNLGCKEGGHLKWRFLLYELPVTDGFSVYALWNLNKTSPNNDIWINALCDEICQRAVKENKCYSEIYLFLHDRDLFPANKTFRFIERTKRHQCVINETVNGFDLHIACFMHEYPDPIMLLLKKKVATTESVAKYAISLLSLELLKEIYSSLNKGRIKWEDINKFAQELPDEEAIRSLFMKGETYRGKELSEIKERICSRINEIRVFDEK